MNTLAINCYGKVAGVCLLQNSVPVFNRELHEGLTHSETLLPLVAEALDATGLGASGFDLIGVTGGPGSFTGLRIGMALAKGLALPRSIPVVAVPTLQAVAEASALKGTVVAALDARRGEVYWAAFDGGDHMRRLTQDAAGPAQQIAQTLPFGPGPVFFVGDGAEICYNIFNYSPVARPLAAGGHTVAQAVARLAEAAFAKGEAGPAAALRPCYLRASQAERQRAEALAKESSG